MGSAAYEKNKASILKHQRKLGDYVRQAKDRPCADCGIRYPFYVMQFDHVRGKKLFNLSSYPGKSMRLLNEEIAKCDVVCANCHAERTYFRMMDITEDFMGDVGDSHIEPLTNYY